jgi:hypothetical protein
MIEVRQPRVERYAEGREQPAANDDDIAAGPFSWLWLARLAANVVGGSLVLAAMFFLPHLIRVLLAGY